MSTIVFFLPIEPPTATHQQKKVNWQQRRFYEPDNVKEARALFEAHLSNYAPDKPIDGPVELTVVWLFGTKTKKLDGTPKTSKPDVSNSHKLLEDCMTKTGFWHDDAQVAKITMTKNWSLSPGIFIKVKEMEQ